MKAYYLLCNEAYLFANNKEGGGKGRADDTPAGPGNKSSMQTLALRWTENAPESKETSNFCGVMMSLMLYDILFKALE